MTKENVQKKKSPEKKIRLKPRVHRTAHVQGQAQIHARAHTRTRTHTHIHADSPAAALVDFSQLILPASVVSRRDVAHLIEEVERVDNALTTTLVRARIGRRNHEKLSFSQQLNDFLEKNGLSLDEPKERRLILKQLRALKDKAPTVHLTFASPADYQSLQRLARWFRLSVNPQVILEAGLQPELIAGVYVRTPNQVHDLSLRATLREKKDILLDDIRGLHGKK